LSSARGVWSTAEKMPFREIRQSKDAVSRWGKVLRKANNGAGRERRLSGTSVRVEAETENLKSMYWHRPSMRLRVPNRKDVKQHKGKTNAAAQRAEC